MVGRACVGRAGSLGVVWCAAVASDPLLCREVVALCPARVCTVCMRLCAPLVRWCFVVSVWLCSLWKLQGCMSFHVGV